MMTHELQDVVEDLGARIARWGWWQDALLVAAMYPREPGSGVRRTAAKVYLLGPSTEQPPMRVGSRATRGTTTWASVPYLDVVDLEKFSYARRSTGR
jgi:hypothetical protein